MDALYQATTMLRQGARAIVEGALVAAIVVALVFAAALAAGHDPTGAKSVFAGQSGGQSWISLDQVNGRATSIQPSLGTSVAFATGYPRTVKNPRIEVLCYQGDTLVYGEAGGVTHDFLLGGGWSIWLGKGGAAECTANLFYFGFHAGKQTYNKLASTSFSAGG